MSRFTPERIAADRARLAELEAEFSTNPNAPFVRENLTSFQRRVARYDAGRPAQAPIAAAPVAATPKPAPVPVKPTATREEKLRRLTAFLGGTAEELATAIKEGTAPDDFALMLSDGTAAERLAARIIKDGTTPDQRTALRPDATAAERLAAQIVKDADLAKASGA